MFYYSVSTVKIYEGKPFVFIGPNVHIGKNVSFNVRKAPAPSPQPTTNGANQISKDVAFQDGEWIIQGEVNMNLTVTLTKHQSESPWETTLTYDLQYALEEMQKYLTFEGELAFQLAKATVIALGAFYTFLNTLPEI